MDSMAAVDRNVKLVDYHEDILIDTILQDYSVSGLHSSLKAV